MNTASTLREFMLANLGAGRWRAGERLPPERQLCEQFGISRGSVRRVLQELKDLGAITQAVGSGTFVTTQAAAAVQGLAAPDPVRHTSPSELMEARLALEPAIIEMVVGHATAAGTPRVPAARGRKRFSGCRRSSSRSWRSLIR